MIYILIATAVTQPNMQYGPLIIGILLFIFTSFVGFNVWLVKAINIHTTALAVISEHNLSTDKDILDSKKAHDEIIDLKVATAELDTKMKVLWSDREDQITETKEEIKQLRKKMA